MALHRTWSKNIKLQRLGRGAFQASVWALMDTRPLAFVLVYDAAVFLVATAAALLALSAAAAEAEHNRRGDDVDGLKNSSFLLGIVDAEDDGKRRRGAVAVWQWRAALCWCRIFYSLLGALPLPPLEALLCDAAPTAYDRGGECVELQPLTAFDWVRCGDGGGDRVGADAHDSGGGGGGGGSTVGSEAMEHLHMEHEDKAYWQSPLLLSTRREIGKSERGHVM